MKRMAELQQQEEEECSQEEMVSRFERERSESIPTGTCWRSFAGSALTEGDSLPLCPVQRWCEELRLTCCCVWWWIPSSDMRTLHPEESSLPPP